MIPRHVDVLVVGAGISGIDAAYRLQTECPHNTFVILEGRERLGGTWDLFRYPGIRSDSDMHTMGFPFRPWTGTNALAGGSAILSYVEDTAAAFGIDRKIRYGMRVEAARWSSERSRWTLDVRDTAHGRLAEVECSFLFMCSGYYSYDTGTKPTLPGHERCRARVVHPQHWPSQLDYAGKRVIVIGSGATAVSIVPEMAKRAAHVTMLQRSPSYFLNIPLRDTVADWTRAVLPANAAHAITKWRNVLLAEWLYASCRAFPKIAQRLLIGGVRQALPDGTDVATHFTPSYGPWDQRVCIVPGGDLFEAFRSGRASVVTDHFTAFTERGVALRSGAVLDADVVVTATGLELQNFGGAELFVDDERVDPGNTVAYRDMMLSGVPNFAYASGYLSNSCTLKCDLTARFVCRLLRRMEREGVTQCRPQRDPDVERRPLLAVTSGYFQRMEHTLPKQGTRGPWRAEQNYIRDALAVRYAGMRLPELELAR